MFGQRAEERVSREARLGESGARRPHKKRAACRGSARAARCATRTDWSSDASSWVGGDTPVPAGSARGVLERQPVQCPHGSARTSPKWATSALVWHPSTVMSDRTCWRRTISWVSRQWVGVSALAEIHSQGDTSTPTGGGLAPLECFRFPARPRRGGGALLPLDGVRVALLLRDAHQQRRRRGGQVDRPRRRRVSREIPIGGMTAYL
jgi:hypothetical protein